jgi:hypothetical protein
MGFVSRLFDKHQPKGEQDVTTNKLGNDTIIFDADVSQLEELKKCQVGDYVKLWVPKDNTLVVSIFRRGSIGGDGRIGYIPSKYSRAVYDHLKNGLEYETEIVEVNVQKSHCKIKCRLISKEETVTNQAKEAEIAAARLKSELQKSYYPKKNLSVRVQLPKDHNLKEGQELYLQKQPLEHYMQNALRIHLDFLDENGIIVAQKTNEPALIHAILRGLFNKLPMNFRLSSIEKPDKYTLKYLENIEAKLEVSFENDT